MKKWAQLTSTQLKFLYSFIFLTLIFLCSLLVPNHLFQKLTFYLFNLGNLIIASLLGKWRVNRIGNFFIFLLLSIGYQLLIVRHNNVTNPNVFSIILWLSMIYSSLLTMFICTFRIDFTGKN